MRTEHKQFIKNMDCFADSQCPPCGAERVLLEFLGDSYTFEGLTAWQAQCISERFAAFITRECTNEPLTISFQEAPESWFVPLTHRAFEYQCSLTYDSAYVRCAGLYFAAQLARATEYQQARVWVPRHPQEWFMGAFENVWRVVCCYQLWQRGGLVVHSAAVVDDHGARIFFGPSGAGKTTVSSLSDAIGLRVLSDELNVFFRAKDQGWMVQGMPFAGDFGQQPYDPIPQRLRGIFRLKKGDTVKVEALPQVAAAVSLCAACPCVNADANAYEKLISTLHSLLSDMPLYELTFAKTSSFWHSVWQIDERTKPSISARRTHPLP